MTNKSYWQEAYLGNASSKAAVKSWFGILCEGMIPYKAEILCDIETDREKKMRAFMTDDQGKNFQFERTLGGKTFSVTRKPLDAVGACRNSAEVPHSAAAPESAGHRTGGGE